MVSVVRGALNTVVSTHAAGAYVSPQIAQGQVNVAGLRLDMWSSISRFSSPASTFSRIRRPT